MLKDKTVYAKLSLSWNKGFNSGIVFPEKTRYCTECEENAIVMIVIGKLTR